MKVIIYRIATEKSEQEAIELEGGEEPLISGSTRRYVRITLAGASIRVALDDLRRVLNLFSS